jgi:hypothetical protein
VTVDRGPVGEVIRLVVPMYRCFADRFDDIRN